MPATPRESRPSGLHSRIASARPGASRSITTCVPSGRLVPWCESRAACRRPRARRSPRSVSVSAVSDVVRAIGRHPALNYVETVRDHEISGEGCAARVLARAVDHPVGTGEHLRLGDAASLMGPDGTESCTIPSVSASCGSTRHPADAPPRPDVAVASIDFEPSGVDDRPISA